RGLCGCRLDLLADRDRHCRSLAPDRAPRRRGAGRGRGAEQPCPTLSVARRTERQMSIPPVLRVSALTKRFHRTLALDQVYPDIAPGEIVALIGPSGCGKSTLLRCLTWLEQPDDGFIEISGRAFGRELTAGGVVRRHGRREIDALRPKIGLVFQQL